MYAVSDAYKTAIQQNSITDSIEGTITLSDGSIIEISDINVKSGTLSIDNQCINNQELEFGAVYAGQCVFDLQTDISRYSLYGAKIELYYNLYLPDDAVEKIPLGIYWITEATRKGVYVSVTALDVMGEMDSDFDGVATLGSPFEILTYLAEKCETTLANTQEEIEAMPNGTGTFQIDATCGVDTWRDAVAIIAQILGGFGTATRDGRLKICQFHTASDKTIEKNQRYSTDISDYLTQYMGVQVQDSSGVTWAAFNELETGLIMSISGNALWDVGLDETKQGFSDALAELLGTISYTPVDVSCTPDPALECGDRITLPTDGSAVESIITSYTWTYRGTSKLTCTGKNPRFTNAKTKAEKQNSKLNSQVTNNKVVFNNYTNASKITVKQKAQQIIAIAATSTTESDALFFAEILFTVEPTTEEKTYNFTDSDGKPVVLTATENKDCTLKVMYLLNGVEDTVFYPVESYGAGQHKMNLFYVLPALEKNQTERLVVKLLTDTGKLSIEKENIKATIIGQGLVSGSKVWDGTIEISEFIELTQVPKNPPVYLHTLLDSISAETQIPNKTAISDVVGRVAVRSASVTVRGLTENVSFKSVIKSFTLSNAEVAFNSDYIINDSGYTMRTKWVYDSTPETVDSGLMCVVQTKTDDLETVESVVVK